MARVRLDDDYRAVEVLGGWALEYQDPARFEWHEFAQRSTIQAIVDAYDAICDGVPVWSDEHIEEADEA